MTFLISKIKNVVYALKQLQDVNFALTHINATNAIQMDNILI